MIEQASGLILRTRPLTDTSLIVHWLSQEFGRIATVAKGARRTRSAFAGKLDLFFLADFSFQRSRRSELHTLREVSLRETHIPIRHEIEYLQQASYCAALIEQTTELEAPIPEIFSLMKDFLRHLPESPPHPLLLYAFEIKLLNELGLQPDLESVKMHPDVKQILRILLVSKWEAIPRIKPSEAQLRSAREFLHGFMVYHLGKTPAIRSKLSG